jgi:hypothetical protein
MTVRSRRSTQEGTGVGSSERRRALFGTPPTGTLISAPSAETKVESWEFDATAVTPRPAPPGPGVEQATPTRIDTPPLGPGVEQATPTRIDTLPSGPPSGPGVEQATPTRIDTPPFGPPSEPPSGPRPGSSGLHRPAREMSLESALDVATPTSLAARPERSEPIRMISMKDQAGAGQPRITGEQPRVPLHVQLRTMAEVAGLHDPPSGLGRLAPPRDPRQARTRRRRDNLVWACVAIGLAGGISLAIWLIAGR